MDAFSFHQVPIGASPHQVPACALPASSARVCSPCIKCLGVLCSPRIKCQGVLPVHQVLGCDLLPPHQVPGRAPRASNAWVCFLTWPYAIPGKVTYQAIT